MNTCLPEHPPRSLLAIATDRIFGPFFGGKLVANIGIWIFNVASVVLVFELTRSPLQVGIVSIIQFLPQILLVSASGAAADRGNRKRQLILGRLLCISGPGMVWVWLLAAGVEGIPVWVVLLAAGLVGVGFSVGGPAMQAMLPALVRPGETPKAVALDNFSFAIGRAVGPAVGAVLAATLGLIWAFAAATIGHLIFAIVIMLLPARLGQRQKLDGPATVRAGVRYVLAHPVVAAILIGVTAIGIGADPAMTLAPSLAEQTGGGRELVGTFASAFGGGAFVIFFLQPAITRWLGTARVAGIGLIAISVGSIGLVWSLGVGWFIGCFAVAGAGMTLALTALGTELYSRVPHEYRGRVMALWLMGFIGSRPLAAGINGFLAEYVSVGSALLVTGTLVLVAAWICRPAVLRRGIA